MNKHKQTPGDDRRDMTRRLALRLFGLGAGSLVALPAWAQEVQAAASAEPLALPLVLQRICGHVGISVPDVEKSALFYSRLFGGENVNGEKSPSLRYFITLGNGGSMAIGKLGTLGSQGKTVPLIDHYCVGARPFNDAAWRARLKLEGLTYIAQGVFASPDGIFVQVEGGQGGESLSVGAVGRLPTLYGGAPLVHSDGYDHIRLHVPDLEKSIAFYGHIFGLKLAERRAGVAYLVNDRMSDPTRLALKQCAAGEAPNIHHVAVRVPKFDRSKMSASLQTLGAKILPAPEQPERILRFADPDGIIVEFWPV